MDRSGRWPTGATRVVGVIGDPVAHSLSPVLHNAAFAALGLDWVYVAFPVKRGEVASALSGVEALGIEGLSVTMPHKSAVAELLADCSEVARRLGSVNTVRRRGGSLFGESTDGEGFLAWLGGEAGFEVADRRCVVLGAGGAGRAVAMALADAGASEVVVVNRDRARGQAAAALAGPVGRTGELDEAKAAHLVVNATPVGMAGVAGGGGRASLLSPAQLRAGQTVVDLVYHPSVTPLMEAAAEAGASGHNGLGMLVHQAALAFTHWTGREAPVEVMTDAVRRALSG